MKRENRYSLQRLMLFVVQGMLPMLLCFGALGCKTPANRAVPSPVAKRALPLTVAPSPSPTPRTKSVPASQATTSPAVVAQPASRPVQEPLRPGQKDPYGRELLFTFRSLVDNAPLVDVQVYGDDRPRIIHIRNHKKLFFLDEKLRIQARREAKHRDIVPEASGRGALLVSSMYAPPNERYITEWLDGNGKRKWRIPSNVGNVYQVFSTANGQRILLAYLQLLVGIVRIEVFDEKGRKVAGHWEPLYPFSFLGASPDRREIAYARRNSSKAHQVVRARFDDLKVLWSSPSLVGVPASLAVGNRFTAVVMQEGGEPGKGILRAYLYLLDQKGHIRWKKQVEKNSRVAFWLNESRIALGGYSLSLLETQQGRMIPQQRWDNSTGCLPVGQLGFAVYSSGFFAMDVSGQVCLSKWFAERPVQVWRLANFLVLQFPTGLYRYKSAQVELMLRFAGEVHR